MIRTCCISLFLSGLFLAADACAQVSASLNDDGFIVLSADGVELLGVDLLSEAGLLVPIPDDDADPFGFLLSNTVNAITFGSLTDPVVVSGELTLGARYTGDPTSGDLVGAWGGPEESDQGPIAFPTAPPPPDGGTDPIIPEPASGLLALIGLVSAGILRRSRKD